MDIQIYIADPWRPVGLPEHLPAGLPAGGRARLCQDRGRRHHRGRGRPLLGLLVVHTQNPGDSEVCGRGLENMEPDDQVCLVFGIANFCISTLFY